MKAVGILGSPRKNSNTEFMLNKALSVLESKGVDTELIPLRDYDIRPCDACYTCWKKGECTQEDDLQAVLEKMVEADAILVGSPVHFGFAHSKLWSLLSRAGFSTAQDNPFYRKIGGPVAVARRAGHNTTFSQLLLWFFIKGFVVPGSTYWNVAVAGSSGERDAHRDEEGINTVENFAENVYWLLERTRD